MTHTPAPWNSKYGKKKNGDILITDEYGNHVTIVKNVKKFGVNGDTEANAHLISAAPELLEALTDLITVITTDSGGLDKQKRVDSHIRIANRAIAKARGL